MRKVKDVDYLRHQIVVRSGKGNKDRVTLPADKIIEPLKAQINRVRSLHKLDLSAGHGAVYLPYALERKYPSASEELGWQYVFPSRKRSEDPRGGMTRRHHIGEQSIQRAIKCPSINSVSRHSGECRNPVSR